jgi:hypothetical protein
MKKPGKSVVSANKSNREIKSIEPKHFGRGRPTKYKPEHVQFAKSLARLGATDAGLADAFQVRISTIRLWMNIYPEFSEAIRVGKDAANKRVERSLYERANGYSYDAVKVFMPAGSKQPVIVHYTEHCPPDVGAAFIWLKNRDPDRWRDVQNVEHVLGKYIISDHPMTVEQWAAERATVVNEVIDDTVGESATPALPAGNGQRKKGP